MNKKNMVHNFIIFALVAAIGIVVYVKFIAVPPQPRVAIDDINSLTVFDPTGAKFNFAKLLDNEGATYVLVLAITDCYSCIYNGTQDLIQLKKDGKTCFALVVHEIVDEVKGWSEKQDFSPFFMIKKTAFYEHINAPVTPVMLKIKDGKVASFRIIKP